MESLPNSAETYAGKKLSELLDYATNDLEPGAGFRLQLEGIQAVPVMHQELEAYFKAELDAKKGAQVVLAFDELTNEMVLSNFSYPLKDVEGSAQLIRTQTLGYVPVIEIRSKQFDSRQAAISFDQSKVLLAGFGIEDFSLFAPEQYKDWRDMLVTQSRAWQVTEKVEIPLAFDADSIQSTTLIRRSTMDLSRFEMIQHAAITRSIVRFHPEGQTDHTDMTLESVKNLDQQELPISVKTYTKKIDIFEESGHIISKEHTTMLPLNKGNFLDFRSALEDVIQLRNA